MGLQLEPAIQDILAKVREIPDVQVFETEREAETSLTYTDETFNPYIVVTFGAPVRAAYGRNIVSSRWDINVMWMTAICVAPIASMARSIRDQVNDKLTEFVPTDAGPLQLSGGANYGSANDLTDPVRYVSGTMFTFRHNLKNDISW